MLWITIHRDSCSPVDIAVDNFVDRSCAMGAVCWFGELAACLDKSQRYHGSTAYGRLFDIVSREMQAATRGGTGIWLMITRI